MTQDIVLLVSRQEAIAAGLARYFTGIPCKYGHVCQRYASAYNCTECHRIRANKKYASDPKIGAAKVMAWYWRHHEQQKAALRARYAAAKVQAITGAVAGLLNAPAAKKETG